MIRKYVIIFISVFVCFSFDAYPKEDNNPFYYYKSEKFYLKTDFSRLSIISTSEVNTDNIGNVSIANKNTEKNYTRQNVIPFDAADGDILITEIEFFTQVNETEYLNIIQQLQKEENVIKVSPTYTVMDKKLGISNYFYVKLFKEEDKPFLYNLAKKHSIQIIGYNEFMPLWFTLSCSKKTPLNVIDVANLFYETGLFESAEPEFLYHDLLASNDPYFSDQWGLKNVGQYGGTSGLDIKAEQAWTLTMGHNVKVAVFDHGFEMNHPDLQNNVYGTGYDATTNTTPAQVRGPHGTACAGIIGAQQNTQGITGVAPNSKLISISINLVTSDTPQQLANGFNWAWQNGADIISNSWGGYAPSSIIENAISNALSYGRKGRGTVVVFASGNENDTNIRYPGNSNPNIIVVGAMSPCGQRKNFYSCDTETAWGSCYGTQLDVVAPGVLIPTTDRQGYSLYNPEYHIHVEYGGNKRTSDYSNQDYTVWFTGTSSACPHVAGVAALILARNPYLTMQQVQSIIGSTAQKVGGYTYQTTSGHPYGTWNNEMGYGLVNAYAAAQSACTTPVYITNRTISSSETVNSCSNVYIENVNVISGANLSVYTSKNVYISASVSSSASLNVNTSGDVFISGPFSVSGGSFSRR
jgi:subtilisin family serine protease